MKPLERRIARLEKGQPDPTMPLTIRRVIVDRMPDGTLKENLWLERIIVGITVTPNNNSDF